LLKSRFSGVGIPAVDPNESNAAMRAAVRFVRSPAGRWFGINVSARVDPFLLKVSRGRLSTFAMAPVVALTVLGRKSGEPRTTPLLYFTHGEEVVLIASSFGREKHPAWYHNLKAHPQATLTAKGRTGTYVAREVQGEERDRLYALAERLYAGYADYVVRAAAAGRTIPVVALRPA
jgi:deazaflavin-dependent oxidoreductase (nitroreductase family)